MISWLGGLVTGILGSLIAALLGYMGSRVMPIFTGRHPNMIGTWDVDTTIAELPDEKMVIERQYFNRFKGYLEASDTDSKMVRRYAFLGTFLTDDIFRYRFYPESDLKGTVRFLDDGVGMIRIDSSRIKGKGCTVFFGIFTEEKIKTMPVAISKKGV